MDGGFKHGIGFKMKYLQYGVIAFIISAAIFISFFVVRDFGVILGFILGVINKFLKALTPLIIGGILAYLFNKPVMFFEKLLKGVKAKRTISIMILYLFIAGIITTIINFVVPSIRQSIVQLVSNDLPKYSDVISYNFNQTMRWLEAKNISFNNTNIESYVNKFSTIWTAVLNWIITFAAGLTQWVFNLVIAMVLAFYILQNKEKIMDSVRELVYLYFDKKYSSGIIDETREFNSILGSYISGMLIDALNVCVLVTIGLKIIGHKYFLLMGVTIGVLNLIPYFGSLIGCTVACLLGLLQGFPMAIYSLITLVVIQQVDGNIIQPKIVGNRVGLGPLWVISAVLVFGSFWGVAGMLLAVPFTALFKAIFKRMIDKRRALVKDRENQLNL